METITAKELFRQLGAFKKVENGPSRNGCGKAPNQFYLYFENGTIFQSYDTIIGARLNGKLYLTASHDCSNTTASHCGWWCGLNTKERRKGLEDGSIIEITDYYDYD